MSFGRQACGANVAGKTEAILTWRPKRGLNVSRTLVIVHDRTVFVGERTIVPTLELVVPKLSVPGLLVADNVTSHRIKLEDYLARVKSDPRLFSVTVSICYGEELSLRLS